jgi:starch synthase
MVDSLVAEVNKPITYEEFAKLAIRYSDGIILNSPDIPESLISYATELGKPVLQHQDAENYAPACNEFYDKVR